MGASVFGPPAHYFPVRPTPHRFQAGLLPFGTDFGNGESDRHFFQIDSQRQRYLAAKNRVDGSRHRVLDRDEAERRVHQRVLAWIRETLHGEHPVLFAQPPDTYRDIAEAVQEDLVVLQRTADGHNAAIAVAVCFPSDWRPERIVGTDFRFIHGPVPGFADSEAQAAAMVAAMIDRGPYVRFVWTLKPSDDLDLHPEEGRHAMWDDAAIGFLRVERQVTVPFGDVGASLFLIRTYLYAFSSLSAAERSVLRSAVEVLPAPVARYKGLAAAKDVILSKLGSVDA
jgi:hypothetical protein